MVKHFVKTYDHDFKLSCTQNRLLTKIAINPEYFEFFKSRIKNLNHIELAKSLGIKTDCIRQELTKLRKIKAIIRKGNNDYINPEIMVKCEPDKEKEIIKFLKTPGPSTPHPLKVEITSSEPSIKPLPVRKTAPPPKSSMYSFKGVKAATIFIDPYKEQDVDGKSNYTPEYLERAEMRGPYKEHDHSWKFGDENAPMPW